MVRAVTVGSRNNVEVEALPADVNIGAFQTPIADVLRTFTTSVASVSGVQNVRIASLALLYFLQCHKGNADKQRIIYSTFH